MSQQSATVARLRSLLESRGLSAPVVGAASLSTGLKDLDVLIGGWPCPGLVEITGLQGAGRLSLLLPLWAQETRTGRPVAVVDPLTQLHPPGLVGVQLPRLLILRPGLERSLWAAEQLAASGALSSVTLLDPVPLRRAGKRLLLAAERGRCVVFVLGEHTDAGLPARLRLALQDQAPGAVQVHLGRCRGALRRQQAWISLLKRPALQAT